MIRVGAYFPEDYDRIDPINNEVLGLVDGLRSIIAPEYARTGFVEGTPIAVAGVIPLWPGVGQGWILIDKAAPKGPRLVYAIRKGLRDIADQGAFHRIQATVLRDFERGQAFLRVLGFVHEGVHVAHGSDGRDHVCMALVNTEKLEDA